ncbi:MAG TPA: sigma-70 family RNA polymerase sigma factor [Bacteroidia bacterium]|jgi:RNA polymerase sigma factor (sigma-70 family)|nr:sigma-70 family RNA polymerase sigma factor [Bacteroidia bacterium]
MATLVFTDKEYIEGLRLSNDAVIRSVYKKFYPVIARMVLNNSGTEQEAKDVFQETVLVLYHHVQQQQFELTCTLQTYLYSVSRRLWLKQLHKKSGLFKLDERFYEGEDVAEIASDLEVYEERDQNIGRMKESMGQLGEPCKTLIEDFYTRHLSMDEIAEKFGYTNADNAKNQKYKCLQRLKKIFFIDKEGRTT